MDQMVAGVFDKQTVTVKPRTRGLDTTAQRAVDPDRQAFTRPATVELAPNAPPTAQRPAGDPAAARSQVFHEAVMSADVRDWPYLPNRELDIVTVVTGDLAGKSFTVRAVEDDGTGRPAFYLGAAG